MSYILRRRRDLMKNSEWRDFVAVTSSVAVLGLGLACGLYLAQRWRRCSCWARLGSMYCRAIRCAGASWLPARMFLIAGAIFFLGVPGIAIARDQARPLASEADPTPMKDGAAAWLSIVRTAPAIIAGAALFAAFDSIMLSFLPLTALGLGFSQGLALGAVSITFAGDAGLQFVAGSLADRFGRLRVQRICALLLCMLLPIARAIYTLSLVASGERFSGGALVRASGLIALTWNVSATAAPLATGIGAHWIGNYAWVAVLWLMAVALLVTLLASEPNSRAGVAWSPKSRLPRA
jgi:hypothetical protein